MKTSTLHELKAELSQVPAAQLLALCLRMARFKKENKELLTYLLFEADDEQGYIENVKIYIDEQFADIPEHNNLYLVKKSLRKILRGVNKYIRYSGDKATALTLLIYYCTILKRSGISIHKSVALTNLYEAQLKKVQKLLPALHEDLQYDFRREIERLN
ncbi:MAG: hypothetical protein IPO83_05390 [Chitinophagaceae bacterium]|nr:hypothetical protein [Chitinophagaceae bacterium]